MPITNDNLFSKKCATPACERRVGQDVEYCCAPCQKQDALFGANARGDVHNLPCDHAHTTGQTIERTFEF